MRDMTWLAVSLGLAFVLPGCDSDRPISGGVVVEGDGAVKGDGGAGRWYYTCGDPVCRSYTAKPNVSLCTDQKAGEACDPLDERCDPKDECNRLLLCATSDPTRQVGGCPISRLDAKTDVEYLGPEDLARIESELKKVKLATYRYRFQPAGAPMRLGFIIDDDEHARAVDPQRDMVDLYTYTSMAVAAVQAQARHIEKLEREIAALRAEIKPAPSRRKRR